MAKKRKPKPIPAGMVQCNECVDGYRIVEDPAYGTFQEACYHCGNTGFITEEHARQDRMRNIAERMGHRVMCDIRDARNRNPDGEDFAFCAAENQCSEYEYGLGIQSYYADRMLKHFEVIDANDRILMDALMDAIDPPTPVVVTPPPANRTYNDDDEDIPF